MFELVDIMIKKYFFVLHTPVAQCSSVSRMVYEQYLHKLQHNM